MTALVDVKGRTVVDMPDVLAVERFEWERWIRRAPLPAPVKLLAFTMATYARQDGSSVRPGNERLARVLACDIRTVRRNKARLLSAGFLECTASPRTAGRADTYQLTIPANIMDLRGLLDPDEREQDVTLRLL